MGAAATTATLFEAFEQGEEKKILGLIKKMPIAELNYVYKEQTALIWAASKGNLQVVKALCERKVDLANTDASGDNALIHAARGGHHLVVEELAKRGANVNSKTKEGTTSLFIAAEAGQGEVVRVLMERRADASIADSNGRLALHHAAMKGHAAVISALLSGGAQSDPVLENDGTTPLFWARTEAGCKALLDGKANVQHVKKVWCGELNDQCG
jgi:uncharacterized protein